MVRDYLLSVQHWLCDDNDQSSFTITIELESQHLREFGRKETRTISKLTNSICAKFVLLITNEKPREDARLQGRRQHNKAVRESSKA